MINRGKLKELLEAEVKKAGGSVRGAAARMKINPTSIQNYIDQVTEPSGRMLAKIAHHFGKPISFFLEGNEEAGIVAPPEERRAQNPLEAMVLSDLLARIQQLEAWRADIVEKRKVERAELEKTNAHLRELARNIEIMEKRRASR